MTLDQLRIFVAVARVESQHRTKLFHRAGSGIELTEAGTLFLGQARAPLARGNGAELVLADLGDQAVGDLMIIRTVSIEPTDVRA